MHCCPWRLYCQLKQHRNQLTERIFWHYWFFLLCDWTLFMNPQRTRRLSRTVKKHILRRSECSKADWQQSQKPRSVPSSATDLPLLFCLCFSLSLVKWLESQNSSNLWVNIGLQKDTSVCCHILHRLLRCLATYCNLKVGQRMKWHQKKPFVLSLLRSGN